jgi:Helix-turn-helix domain
MPAAVKLRTDSSVDELRRLAKDSKDANQSRRLLSLAAVLDGMNRADAARIGGMDRQTLRDWVHRFNKAGRPARRLGSDITTVSISPRSA